MLPKKRDTRLRFQHIAVNLAQIDRDLGKAVDVGTALRKLHELDPRLPDAVHDWLIVGKAKTTVCRDYKIGKETLDRAKQLLQEMLEDYA